MRNNLSFWLSFVLSGTVCLAAVSRLTPPQCYRVPVDLGARLPDPFLAIYQDIGLDYYVFRFGLLGTGAAIRKADIICASSSKGLYGFDPETLATALSTPERAVRVFNLSFGFGEGFGYLTEVIKTLDLRDKVLLADLTDNTSHWHFTPMAREALHAQNALDGYKALVERWLTFERGRLLEGRLPRVAYDAEKGFVLEHALGNSIAFRSLANGSMMEAFKDKPLSPAAGTYAFAFDADGQLKSRFLEECSARNIQIVFTSIPYQGYDVEWGGRVAAQLGYPHVPVADDGIELIDPTHMATNGRRLFSARLGRRLRETGAYELAAAKARMKPQPQTAARTGQGALR